MENDDEMQLMSLNFTFP